MAAIRVLRQARETGTARAVRAGAGRPAAKFTKKVPHPMNFVNFASETALAEPPPAESAPARSAQRGIPAAAKAIFSTANTAKAAPATAAKFRSRIDRNLLPSSWT
jgi:hypothetical protein